MRLVRPFSGRVVRPEWASRLVRPLEGDAGLDSSFDLAAYGPLTTDRAYAYRLTAGSAPRTALVVGVALAGFADGRVLGHEAVRPDRVARLVDVFDSTPHRSDLISVLHQGAQPAVAAPSDEAAALWSLSVDETSAVMEQLSGPTLYVADGHHRVAASLRRWERARRPDVALACAVFAANEVELHAFHRRVRGPVDAEALLTGLAEHAVQPAPGPTRERHALGVYAAGAWWRATSLATQRLSGIASLDVTRLDEDVLGPLLGLAPGDSRVEPVSDTARLAEAVRACDDDGGVLFTLAAPGVSDLMTVADRGEVMSAKTTYVQPKPPIGAFLSTGF